MSRLIEFLKRHQLFAFFFLTYLFMWSLLFSVQPLFLEGQKTLAPLISLAVFTPALVSIGLSALLKPGPRLGNRKSTVIAFIIAWIIASIIILLYLIVIEKMEATISLGIVCGTTGLLPAYVVSSAFSTIPGVKDHLSTYIKPRGSVGYYILAIFLFPALWFFGNLLSRTIGMDSPFTMYPVDIHLPANVILFFLYGVIYGGLSEEPGWRGFALPRLQAKYSPLGSGLLLGIIWAVWHAPARFGGIEAKSLSDTLVEWVLIILVSVIFTWFFNRTKGSVLVTAVIHPAMNTATTFLTGSLGALILLFIFMVLVIVVDRMWRKLPPDSLAIYRVNAPAIT